MRILTLLTAALMLAGCQRYQPQPLDLASHQRDWAARDPASPDVVELARRMSSASTCPAVFDPADGVSLDEANAVALVFNARLRVARSRAAVASAGATEAGRWQDPTFRLDAERIVESVQHPWVVGGMVDLTLPLSGTPGAEKELATAQARAAWASVATEEREVLDELGRAWIDLAAITRKVELTQAYLDDLAVLADQAEKLRTAAEMSPLEAGLFTLERARRRTLLMALDTERRDRELDVKALMGLVPDAPVRLLAELPALSSVDAADRWKQVEANHPRLRSARADHDAADRKLQLEIRKQYPDLTVGGGFGRDEGVNRVLGGLAIPIPIFDANRRGIAEAVAERDASRAAAEATVEELRSALVRAETSAAGADERLKALERDVAPLADTQVKAARQLGRAGAIGAVAVFEALSRAQEARLDIVDAAAARALAHHRLDLLTQPSTTTEVNP